MCSCAPVAETKFQSPKTALISKDDLLSKALACGNAENLYSLYITIQFTPFHLAGGIVGGGWAGMGSSTLTNLFKGEKVFKTSRKYGGYFRNEADHRDFVSIGTAAGTLNNSLGRDIQAPKFQHPIELASPQLLYDPLQSAKNVTLP